MVLAEVAHSIDQKCFSGHSFAIGEQSNRHTCQERCHLAAQRGAFGAEAALNVIKAHAFFDGLDRIHGGDAVIESGHAHQRHFRLTFHHADIADDVLGRNDGDALKANFIQHVLDAHVINADAAFGQARCFKCFDNGPGWPGGCGAVVFGLCVSPALFTFGQLHAFTHRIAADRRLRLNLFLFSRCVGIIVPVGRARIGDEVGHFALAVHDVPGLSITCDEKAWLAWIARESG